MKKSAAASRLRKPLLVTIAAAGLNGCLPPPCSAEEASNRALIGRELSSMVDRLRAAYLPEGVASEVTADERRWGLIPTTLYREAVEETLAKDYRPRFAALGIQLSRAVAGRIGSRG